MEDNIDAKYLLESDLNYILSLNSITSKNMFLCTKISIAQKLLNLKKCPVTKNFKFDVSKEVDNINETMAELDASITAFCGLQSDSDPKGLLNRLIFLNHRVKHFKVPDEPEESKLLYSDWKDYFLSEYYGLKVKFNTKLRPTPNLKEKHQRITSHFKKHFEHIQFLGFGSFGAVIEVKHKYDGCRYAVKRVDLDSKEMSRQTFMREVTVLAKLDHENIVGYYSSWIEQQTLDWKEGRSRETPLVFLYIQMELCQKQSLGAWLHLNKVRKHGNMMKMFLQILDAVIYFHSKDVIHRDLKPDNIFFAKDGTTIKVGDFGLALDVGNSSSTKGSDNVSRGGHTKWVGTELYMSPELNSGTYNHKVDIYALGIILFELLVHFSRDGEHDQILTELRAQKYPEGFAERYPLEFLLIQNMLSENPEKRSTATEIKVQILSALDDNNNFRSFEKNHLPSDNGEENNFVSVIHQENFLQGNNPSRPRRLR